MVQTVCAICVATALSALYHVEQLTKQYHRISLTQLMEIQWELVEFLLPWVLILTLVGSTVYGCMAIYSAYIVIGICKIAYQEAGFEDNTIHDKILDKNSNDISGVILEVAELIKKNPSSTLGDIGLEVLADYCDQLYSSKCYCLTCLYMPTLMVTVYCLSMSLWTLLMV